MAVYTLQELAELTSSELIGDPEHQITGVEDLEAAASCDAAFLDNPRYEKQLHASQAGVIFVLPQIKQTNDKNYLINRQPSLAFQKVVELFMSLPASGFSKVHPTAVIHEEASIGKNVTIGPHAVIDRGAKIGPGTTIGANSFIGAETIVAEQCFFYPNVVVREGCIIGNRVILQPGVVIGSCGFGYYTDNDGVNHKLKQFGKVVVEDDVEIGANTTIDRARFKTTRIGKGTKLDNLIQIGHQVELGENNLMAAQVGIAGSTKTGRNVVMAGQVGVAGHLDIVSGCTFAARAAVSKSTQQPGIYSGIPAGPIKETHLHYVQLKSIGKLIDRIKKLEATVGGGTKNSG